MVRARPDLFHAYVGTGQVGDGPRSDSVAHLSLLEKARRLGNLGALEDLTQLGPPPYETYRESGILMKWANSFEGSDGFLAGSIGLRLVAPGGSVQDVNDSVKGLLLSGERLAPPSKLLGPKELGLDFTIPIFVFQGSEDCTTPTALAHEYLDLIRAPQKEFVPIEGGGHFAVFMRSDRFLQELVSRVRPLALPR